MAETIDGRDLAALQVHKVGSVVATGDSWHPFDLIDGAGVRVEPVAEFLRDLQASGRSAGTARSYAMDLLRWFRFLWSIECGWHWADRAVARDFCRWMMIAPRLGQARRGLSAAVRAHAETVLRSFYQFHLEAGTGPVVNPFPLARAGRGRAHAHHDPMEPFRNERSGRYRPKLPKRLPRNIPDDEFNSIFTKLASHRDRAMVAFYVSTGARASELLSVTQDGVDPGRQVITVMRKGSGARQDLPASIDAFIWWRLYQTAMGPLMPRGEALPAWWTSRAPVRPLTYHGVHRMFERAAAAAGSKATLHALRHTAAYRMSEDPLVSLTDVQFVLGHAQLSTTQIYVTPRQEDVVRRVLAHHASRAQRAAAPPPPPAPGYDPTTLAVLFGESRR